MERRGEGIGDLGGGIVCFWGIDFGCEGTVVGGEEERETPHIEDGM